MTPDCPGQLMYARCTYSFYETFRDRRYRYVFCLIALAATAISGLSVYFHMTRYHRVETMARRVAIDGTGRFGLINWNDRVSCLDTQEQRVVWTSVRCDYPVVEVLFESGTPSVVLDSGTVLSMDSQGQVSSHVDLLPGPILAAKSIRNEIRLVSRRGMWIDGEGVQTLRMVESPDEVNLADVTPSGNAILYTTYHNSQLIVIERRLGCDAESNGDPFTSAGPDSRHLVQAGTIDAINPIDGVLGLSDYDFIVVDSAGSAEYVHWAVDGTPPVAEKIGQLSIGGAVSLVRATANGGAIVVSSGSQYMHLAERSGDEWKITTVDIGVRGVKRLACSENRLLLIEAATGQLVYGDLITNKWTRLVNLR